MPVQDLDNIVNNFMMDWWSSNQDIEDYPSYESFWTGEFENAKGILLTLHLMEKP